MNTQAAEDIKTFGDVRRLILETVVGVRDGSLDIGQGAVIAANFKELNNNIKVEIEAAKLAVLTTGTAHEFGSVRKLGLQVIAEESIAHG